MVYLVVSSPPAIEDNGAMGGEIESRQGIRWHLYKKTSPPTLRKDSFDENGAVFVVAVDDVLRQFHRRHLGSGKI
jgi:hypothetical protein